MSKKIIITGATGLIGSKISKALMKRGDKIYIFSRSPENAEKIIPGAEKYIKWTPQDIGSWIDHLEGIDSIIHLAGENPMSRRWSEAHKKRIMQSRIVGTRGLINALNQVKNKPKSFISASAMGYYGLSLEGTFTEESPAGDDFMSHVVIKWEKESSDATHLGLRWAAIRLGMVLDPSGGALGRMITPFKYFIGGSIGSGRQWFSWIHIDDVVGIFLYALDNEIVKGPINATAPNPLTMKQFADLLGKVMGRPSFFTAPSIALKILFGEGANFILNGSRVVPKRILDYGYKFKFEEAEAALKELVP